MSVQNVFTNQTTDTTVVFVDGESNPIIIEGVCKIDISGVLDGATMSTECLEEGVWFDIVEATWDGLDTPPPVLPASAYPLIAEHELRFVLSNAGLATDITVDVTYDA